MTSALATPVFCVFGMHSLFLHPGYTHFPARDTLTFSHTWDHCHGKRRDTLARIPRALAAESGIKAGDGTDRGWQGH
jgi:hypothetical protein